METQSGPVRDSRDSLVVKRQLGTPLLLPACALCLTHTKFGLWMHRNVRRWRSQNHAVRINSGSDRAAAPNAANCVDGLLIHRDREPSRPILESSESKNKHRLFFWSTTNS